MMNIYLSPDEICMLFNGCHIPRGADAAIRLADVPRAREQLLSQLARMHFSQENTETPAPSPRGLDMNAGQEMNAKPLDANEISMVRRMMPTIDRLVARIGEFERTLARQTVPSEAERNARISMLQSVIDRLERTLKEHGEKLAHLAERAAERQRDAHYHTDQIAYLRKILCVSFSDMAKHMLAPMPPQTSSQANTANTPRDTIANVAQLAKQARGAEAPQAPQPFAPLPPWAMPKAPLPPGAQPTLNDED